MSHPPPHLLPAAVRPSAYRLTIEPDLDASTYRGSVEIDVAVTVPTRVLRLNGAELNVTRATVRAGGRDHDPVVAIEPASELIALDLKAEITGPATVAIEFAGSINDRLQGFYRSTYVDDDGLERVIGVTQMEATEARRVFPCFDQPDMKATFELTLLVATDHLAVSNTAPREVITTSDGRQIVRFSPTIPMSTYLVAWVVGPLDATEPIDVGGVPVRVVHRPGRGQLTSFALDVARHALAWFVDYYGLPYPGDKLDLVALPDFASGAMENLGCVTFREILLLVDPEQATQPELQEIADVVNHEIAHMWFGDLVTMRWWNGLWLNEAFATFMEIAATDAYRPDWKRWSDFSNSRALALEIDGLSSTRAVEYPVVTPTDADDMFDVLTYHKGAAVLRMLEQYIGERDFREGVRHYLERHAFGNTDTHDLWDALDATSGAPARQIMDSWIFQGGYPLVEVERSSPTRIRLRQSAFRYLGPPLDGELPGSDPSWHLPIRVRDAMGELTTLVIGNDPVDVDLEHELVTVNSGASGFYRVLDPAPPSLERLGPGERHAHLDDTAALVLAGRLPTTRLLDVIHALRSDDDLLVWQRIHHAIEMLDNVIDERCRAGWRDEVVSLVEPALQHLGLGHRATDDDRTRELRATVLTIAGTAAALPQVLDHARSVVAGEAPADPAIAAAAVVISAHHGDTHLWEDLRTRAVASTNPQLVERYQRSLAQFPDTSLTLAACDLCLTDEIRTQDAPFLLRLAFRNRIAGPAAWQFVQRRWSAIRDRLPPATVHRMLEGVRWLSRPDDAAAVAEFLAAHPVETGSRQVSQHLERLRINAAWRARSAIELDERYAGPT